MAKTKRATAKQRMFIKTNLVCHFERKGFNVCGNDTSVLCLFSDRPLTSKSKYWGNYGISSYITSFGEKEAQNILQSVV